MAGFLDAEGCFRIRSSSSLSETPEPLQHSSTFDSNKVQISYSTEGLSRSSFRLPPPSGRSHRLEIKDGKPSSGKLLPVLLDSASRRTDFIGKDQFLSSSPEYCEVTSSVTQKEYTTMKNLQKTKRRIRLVFSISQKEETILKKIKNLFKYGGHVRKDRTC